jgi:hypothetical protein
MTKKKETVVEVPAVNSFPGFPIEQIELSLLKPHPQNYRIHPTDQIAHLVQSIKEHGFYRNVVIAQDNTILAGHGIALAAQEMGLFIIPVIRLLIAPDSVQALKVLAGDNEIEHLAEQDDRLLTELLKSIMQEGGDAGLLGTGYDGQMLANLLYVTRPETEIESMDEASHWVGMPEYNAIMPPPKLIISFESEGERDNFLKWLDQQQQTIVMGKNRDTWSMWWPPREKEDLKALKWEG